MAQCLNQLRQRVPLRPLKQQLSYFVPSTTMANVSDIEGIVFFRADIIGHFLVASLLQAACPVPSTLALSERVSVG
jgi:hypothetical protein